jgi:hypothetical protein
LLADPLLLIESASDSWRDDSGDLSKLKSIILLYTKHKTAKRI